MESKVIEDLKKDVASLQVELLSLKQRTKVVHDAAKERVNSISSTLKQAEDKASLLKSIRDVSGKKSPSWYEVDIFFEAGDSEPNSGSTGISSGPFVCTQMQSLYMNTDQDATHFPPISGTLSTPYPTNAVGRPYPCTAFFNTITQFSGVTTSSGLSKTLGELFSDNPTATVPRGVGWNYPEFDFTIQIQGSGRYWTSSKTPAAAFYGTDNPLYVGYEGLVDAFDRIIVTAYPTIPVQTSGFVRFVFFGYEISTKKTISDLLGY